MEEVETPTPLSSVSSPFRSPATPKKLQPLQKKDSKEIPQISDVRGFHTFSTLIYGLLFFVILILSLLFANLESLKPIFQQFFDTIFVGSYYTVTGNFIAAISFAISLIAFFRYFKPKPKLNLTNQQKLLLGLPPEKEISSAETPRKEEKKTPSLVSSPSQEFFYSPFSSDSSQRGLSALVSPPSSFQSNFPFAIPNEPSVSTYRQPVTTKNEIIFDDMAEEIKTEKELKNFVEYQSTQQEIKNALEQSYNYPFIPPSLQYKPAQRFVSETKETQKEPTSEPYWNDYAASQLLEELNISEEIEAWCHEMKKWISAYILSPLVDAMEKIEKINSVTPIRWNLPQSSELKNIVSKIEKYLQVPGATSREYLTNRIKVLAKKGFPEFKWNGGGFWKDKVCAPEFGTDSQIIMHLFCTFMDMNMAQGQSDENRFSSNYFVMTPQKPENKKVGVVIYQTKLHPPHFQIVLTDEDKTCPVVSGPKNLFHTLVLFIYFIRSKHRGIVGDNTWLGGRHINLLQVIN